MIVQWTDATSYSQGQRGKIEPTAWECRINGVRLWVSCGHIYYPGEWVMNSEYLGFDKKRVGSVRELSTPKALARAMTLASEEAKKRAQNLIEFARACEAQP